MTAVVVVPPFSVICNWLIISDYGVRNLNKKRKYLIFNTMQRYA